MIICFIAGDKNSGQCGITDYVELLAQELEKLGHQIEQYFIKKDCGELNNLPKADLYSFQFAPYAFANNGMPSESLTSLLKNCRTRECILTFMKFGLEHTLEQIGRKGGSDGFKKTLFLALSISANRHGSPRPMPLRLIA